MSVGWEMQLDPLKTVRATGARGAYVTVNGLMDSIQEKISDSRKLYFCQNLVVFI